MIASTTQPAPARTPHRRARRSAGNLVFAVALVFWALFLRPDALGGSASYVLVSGHSMQPNLQTGDLVITHRKDTYAAGDVIAYRVPKGEPGAGARVIHRVIGGSARDGFRTQGDNREEPDIWRPRPRDIEGTLWVRLPKLGTLLLMLSTPFGLATSAGLMAFLMVGGGAPPPKRRASTEQPAPREDLVPDNPPEGPAQPDVVRRRGLATSVLYVVVAIFLTRRLGTARR